MLMIPKLYSSLNFAFGTFAISVNASSNRALTPLDLFVDSAGGGVTTSWSALITDPGDHSLVCGADRIGSFSSNKSGCELCFGIILFLTMCGTLPCLAFKLTEEEIDVFEIWNTWLKQ